VDPKHYERQIRLVVVLFRAEQRHPDSPEMLRFRDRAEAIFNRLEPDIRGDRRLVRMLAAARRELRLMKPSPGRGIGQQAVNATRQFLDGERLR
jgi:hypothetical protein